MSASASTRLRQLATQYHGGELNLQNYRRLRAELLDRLTSADASAGANAGTVASVDESSVTLPKYPRPPAVLPSSSSEPAMLAAPAMPAPVTSATPAIAAPVAVIVPVAPAKPATRAPAPQPPRVQPATAPRSATPAPDPTPPPTASAAAPARSGGGGKFVVVLVIVAAIGAGAFWYFKLRPAASASADTEQAVPTAESYRAINDFLAGEDWSDEQIANFNSRWSTLPDDMRNAAIEETWYQEFVGRVRSQVKERRALMATADSVGTVDGPLSALASSLGIDVSSPDAVVVRSRIRPNAAASDPSGSTRATGLQPANSTASAERPKDSDAPPATTAASTPAATPGATKSAAAATQPASAAKHAALVNTADVANPDKCRVELVGSRKPRCRDALNVGGFGPFLAMIPAGGFDMGSKQVAQEQPVHRVTIAKPFAIAEFETSQAEFQLFCSHTKRACEAHWQGGDFPMVRVNWRDARDYAAWLSEVSGKSYRLATEAEWEYAARGGSSGLFPSGDALSQTDAVFSVTDKLGAPWPRSQRINANAFRLYHSIGNVREWVDDAWLPSFAGAPSDGSARAAGDAAQRVVRGGAYTDAAAKLRFTTREGVDATTRDLITGFRVVREL